MNSVEAGFSLQGTPSDILDSLPAAIYATDAEGRITYFNEAAAALWSRRPQLGEDLWCGSWRLFWPDGRPMAHDECPMAVAIKTGENPRGVEAVAERPDGTRFTFVPYPTVLRDASGKLTGAVNMLVDVTDYRRIEDDLRRREAELRDFVENTTVGLHWVGPDGALLWANRAEMEMLGYAPEEYIGRKISEFHADAEVIDDVLSRLARFETLQDYEARMVSKDGSIKHVLIDSSVYRDPITGEFVHTRCYTREITDQKRLEQRLGVSAAISQILAESHTLDEAAPGVLGALCDHFDAEIAEIWLEENNRLSCRAFQSRRNGETTEKFRRITEGVSFGPGEGVPGRVWQTKAPFWLRQLSEVVHFQRRQAANELGLRTSFGMPILLGQQCLGAVMCFATHDEQADAPLLSMMTSIGQKLGMFVERTRLEEANRQLAAIVDAASDAIVASSVGGVITSWNRGAERLFGYSADEAIDRSLELVIPSERKMERLESLESAKRGEAVPPFETMRRNKAGDLIPLSVSFFPIRNGQGTILGSAAIVRDISEQKRAEARLAARVRQMQSVAELGKFVIEGYDVQGLFDRAVALLAEGLEVEYAKILEVQAEGKGLLLRAGIGWRDGLVGNAVVEAGSASQAGYTLKVNAPVVVKDLAAERRFNASPLLLDHGVVSGLSCVIHGDAGKPFGAIGAYTGTARAFSDDDIYFLQSVANVVSSAIERKTHEDRRELLTRELSHRVKNNLSVVQAIASQSAKYAESTDQFLQTFSGRLTALTQAHDLLTSNEWVEASFATLLGTVIEAQAAEQRMQLDIEDFKLNPSGTQTMTLLLHELTTNALKYGALSGRTGTVAIRGRREAVNGEGIYVLSWQESGGPPVQEPSRLGFGSKLVAGMVKHCGGDLETNWERQGFSAVVRLPLSSLAGH